MLKHFAVLAAVGAGIALPPEASGDGPIGQRVFWKDSAQPRVGPKSVDPALIPYPATVTKLDRDWLWLERAWVRQADVLAVDEALTHWTEQIGRRPTADWAYAGRAGVWSEKGELENALADLTEAIRLDPTQATTWNNRGHAWDLKGEFENAIKDYTEAIRLKPAYATAHSNRGLARLASGDCAGAIMDCTEAIRLDPASAHAYVARASARFQAGDYDRAIQDIETAMRISPTNPGAMDALAWLRATCPDAGFRDGASALEWAHKAGDLEGWAHAGNFDTLAAAHAEAGDMPAAIVAQEQAVAMQTRTFATPRDRRAYAAALEHYRAGTPCRDEPGVGNLSIQAAE